MTSTSSHPAPTAPDATSQGPAAGKSAPAASTAELASSKIALKKALRQFPDFPSPGIVFEDICPLFRSHDTHTQLIDALAAFVDPTNGGPGRPDIVVGLDARGFLFGPGLALRLGAGFVPVRKKGKLPGDCVTAKYAKEYGVDEFQMQADAIEPGQGVLVVDDIIATGGSAAAAGELVQKLGGRLIGYVFMLELDFLRGREKLNAPVFTLLSSQEAKKGNQE
ncbi:MAG: adenine phosphoribosyltransferase [Stictis urceolatum]|nr:adenine phosphoribosyltransferase [Stictis urceolata]